MTSTEILAKLQGRRFNARTMEALLRCHVTTVELHALVERGELSCDGLCGNCAPAEAAPAPVVEEQLDADGFPIPVDPEAWNAQMQQAAAEPPATVLRDRKGAPITVERAPCTFAVEQPEEFGVWLDAKLDQRDRNLAERATEVA